ncbi:hypothetical protein [Elongatibacter sediminis]|uniref:hypothetical protein n=1 Tax=Elongatibacter sediminis TaxID=3119006 RepID=UPI00339D46A5
MSARTARIFIAFTIALAWSRLCPAVQADLGARMERVLADEGLVGVAWSLVGADGDTTVGSAGLRDNSSALAFEPETRFASRGCRI